MAGRRSWSTVAQELEVRRAAVGVVERGVDRLRVEAEEPGRGASCSSRTSRRAGTAARSATSRARSGRPRARSAALGARARVARVAQERDARPCAAGGSRKRRVELGVEPVEGVPVRRLEAGPGREVADVARGHAERVRHERRQVRRGLAVEDPGDRRGEEAVDGRAEVERRRAGTAAGRTSAGGTRARPRRGPAPGRRSPGAAWIASARVQPARGAPTAQARRSAVARVRASATVGGSSLAAVRRWANGLRSLPTPIRPSATAWSGAVPRPENGSRTTSPGRL